MKVQLSSVVFANTNSLGGWKPELESASVRGVVSGEANPASNRQQLGPLLTISRDAKLGLTEHRIEEHLDQRKRLNRGKSPEIAPQVQQKSQLASLRRGLVIASNSRHCKPRPPNSPPN